jgi:hypothetical protein
MGRFVVVQNNFSVGEVDPLLRARMDLQQYQNALAKATNVDVQPQGGITRRPGLRKITEITVGTPANGIRLVPFEFSVTDSYLLVFVDQKMIVVKDGAVIPDINGGSLDYLTTTITSAMLGQLTWTQSADTMIICHPDLAPQALVRGATDASWTIGSIAFDSTPYYQFSVVVRNPATTLTPSATSGQITLTAGATTFHNGTSGTATAGASTTITLAGGASATDDIYNGAVITITGGTGAGQSRVITDYVGSTKVATVVSAWSVTPGVSSTYTVSNQIGQYINGTPQGRAKIIGYTSDTVVQAVTEYPFFSAAAMASGNWELETGYEAAWSASRGYPRSVTFHEGRLYFGGSSFRPSTIWGSKVGLYWDFNPVTSYDDDAVEATLDTNQLNVITDIISGRDLQIFTTGGEFYVAQAIGEPVTPTNFFIKTVSRAGSKPGVRVQQLDTGTLFVQRSGKSLNELLFSDSELSYISNKISLLSSHLLKTPTRMGLRRAISTNEGDKLMIVNSYDGTMAVYSILRAQNVIAPSEYITDGLFKDVAVDVTDVYVAVKRTFNSTDKYYIELFDPGYFTDCAMAGASGAGASSLPHVGKTVDIIRDGVVEAQQVVPVGGSITFARAATTSWEVGLPITIYAKTLPVEPRLPVGSRTSFKKRIVEVTAILNSTQELLINSQQISFRSFGEDVLDDPVQEFTGNKQLHSMLGYTNDAAIEITQGVPLKMTLLGLDYKVSVYGGT